MTPILAAKLYIPPLRKNAVSRLRLIERLNEGLGQGQGFGRKLSLISAPAGFGKTTLVSEWAAGCSRRVAWLWLEERDSDTARFLTYLVAAMRTVAPDLGGGVLRVLHAEQPRPAEIEAILTALLNEITSIPDDIVLVLDDYHAVDATAIDAALTFFIEHLPPNMHLVVTTREDPQLPLARLRARGQLTELRAADLRFTPAEAAEFLEQVMGLTLAAEDIAALEDRTEGWIAGLQLAALSMQGHEDLPGFVRAFAGDHRYIVDYLVAEVLQRQPRPVRSFLLQTAILDRLNGPLCDAVTGLAGSDARLEALERGNFFVVPLDDRRQWYRYHHLFADVLSAHLLAEHPDQVPTLHRRASEWYERNSSLEDAIHHALAAEDFERAADLVERAVPTMRRSRREATMLGWLQALPDEVLHYRPVLSVHYAGALLANGRLEGVEARLRDAERWLEAMADMGERPEAPSAGASLAETRPEQRQRMVVVDAEGLRRLPGWVAIYRAGSAVAQGDVANTMRNARRALDLVPEEDNLGRGAAAGLLGLAHWTSGDLEAAHRAYADCMARVQQAGHISDAIGCAIALADIRIAQGRLREAMSTYERGLLLATERGEPALRGAADMHVGMSELHREHGELDATTQHLHRSKELGRHAGLPQNPYRWCVAMARIRQSQGDPDSALDLLDEAERVCVSDLFPYVRPVAASKTRVWISQGRFSEAVDWAHDQGLTAEDDLSYLREFEHITLARLLLARYQSNRSDRSIVEAMAFLERLLQAAEAGNRTGSVIEILVLQALAHHLRGDIPAALAPLECALTLAEPEGYVRTFVDEGLPMRALLREAAQHGIAPDYVLQLLSALPTAEDRTPVKRALIEPAALIEPLSERELQVLRLLGGDLNGPEMAGGLMVSLNTLRSHTKNIYAKLGVNDRRAAVRRAGELALL